MYFSTYENVINNTENGTLGSQCVTQITKTIHSTVVVRVKRNNRNKQPKHQWRMNTKK